MRTDQTAPPPAKDVGVVIPVTVYFDDMDMLGMLHNSRFQVLVERAWVTFWRDRGFIGESGLEGDAFNVLKAFTISFELPVRKPGEYAVHLWMDRVGNTSATAGYRVCSAESDTTYARGTRTIVRLDPTTLLPTAWSDRAREIVRSLEVPGDAP